MSSLPQLVKISSGNLLGRLSIDYDKDADVIRGGLSIVDLRTGKVTASRQLEVPIGKIRDMVIALHAAKRPSAADELAGDAFAMAGFWSDVKKRANKVAKTVGNRKLLKIAQKVMNDPRFTQVTAIASTVYPPLGMTVASIKTANDLVLRASARDPAAIAKVAMIVDKAKGGDPAAGKVAAAFMALKQAHDHGADPIAEVGAWLARKERPALIARPVHTPTLRSLYHAAVNR